MEIRHSYPWNDSVESGEERESSIHPRAARGRQICTRVSSLARSPEGSPMERSVGSSVRLFARIRSNSRECVKCWLLYPQSNSSVFARKAPPCLFSEFARQSFSFVNCRVRVPGLFSLVLPFYSVSICPLDLLKSVFRC